MQFTTKQFIEITSVIAVVLSLLFVGFELRLSRSIAETENINQEADLYRSINEYISDNAEVWERGCLGDELTPSEEIRYTNMTLAVINHEYNRWRRSEAGISIQRTNSATLTVAENLHNFPGFKKVWERSNN